MKNNKTPLISELLTINTKPIKRVAIINKLIKSPALLSEVINITKKKNDLLSGKAARGIELVAVKDIQLVLNYVDDILRIAATNTRDDTTRSMAKIIELLSIHHFSKKSNVILSLQQKEKMTSICFDWMISPKKTAVKAHSMQSLFLLGTEFKWIHPELKLIVEQNYNEGSAGYKARARMILSKLS